MLDFRFGKCADKMSGRGRFWFLFFLGPGTSQTARRPECVFANIHVCQFFVSRKP
jgi:hypothetical protein